MCGLVHELKLTKIYVSKIVLLYHINAFMSMISDQIELNYKAQLMHNLFHETFLHLLRLTPVSVSSVRLSVPFGLLLAPPTADPGNVEKGSVRRD